MNRMRARALIFHIVCVARGSPQIYVDLLKSCVFRDGFNKELNRAGSL